VVQGFFQRSLSRKIRHDKCVADGRMEWSEAVRTCPHCRHRRCLQAGMSRDGRAVRHYYSTRHLHLYKYQLSPIDPRDGIVL